MITIVSRWESSQMPAELEWRMWRQLRGSFGIDRFIFTPIIEELRNVAIDQFATMEEALESAPGVKTFLEPTGKSKIADIKSWVSDDLILVIGNTSLDNLKHARDHDNTLRLTRCENAHLYGTNAAAIALSHWVDQ